MKINSEFSYRYSVDDIRQYHGDLAEAFRRGDYNLVAAYADTGSELEGLGLLLCGLHREGMAVLSGLQSLSPLSTLCRSYGHWLACDFQSALSDLSLLSDSDEPYRSAANRLRKVIEAENLNVVVVSVVRPVFAEGDSKWLEPVVKYGQFTVKHVTNQLARNAYDDAYSFGDPFDEFLGSLPIDEQPLFVFSMSPQSVLPKGYERVKTPKIMWCHDTDLFLYRGFENFQLNDLNIVTTSQEHFELNCSLERACASNMMSDTLCLVAGSPKMESEKDIDILFSGAAVSSFHSEKSRFLYTLSKLSDEFCVRIIDGHLERDEYLDLLKRSRFVPIVNRYAGAVSPRWHEALSNSAFLLYPEGTPFGKASPGTFSFKASCLEEDIRSHLRANIAHGEHEAGAYNIHDIFEELETALVPLQDDRLIQFERQLKFCTISLILSDMFAEETKAETKSRRVTWYVPPIDGMLWGHDLVRERMSLVADSIEPNELEDDRAYNDKALIYTHMVHGLAPLPDEREEYILKYKELMEEGIENYPNSLLLLFNQAHWEFMLSISEGAVPDLRVLEKFAHLLENFDRLEFEPTGSDVGIAYTLLHLDAVFPYYEYSQMMVRFLVGKNVPQHMSSELARSPLDAIRAASWGYIGWGNILLGAQPGSSEYDQAIESFEKSLGIYPDNLPLLRLRFHSIVRLWPLRGEEVGSKIIDAFTEYAAKYPTTLLDNIEDILPVVSGMGDEEMLESLLAKWYAFANCIEYVAKDDEHRNRQKFIEILKHAEAFPASLRTKLESNIPENDMTLLERTLREAKIYLDWSEYVDRDLKNPTDIDDQIDQTKNLRLRLKVTEETLNQVLNSRTWRWAKKIRTLAIGR